MEEISTEIVNLIDTWKTLGALAGIAFTLQLIMKSLKHKAINALFVKYKIKWIKPYIAMSLGGISGGIGAYLSGVEITNGIFAGIMAGITSVGWNETVNKLKSSKRTK